MGNKIKYKDIRNSIDEQLKKLDQKDNEDLIKVLINSKKMISSLWIESTVMYVFAFIIFGLSIFYIYDSNKRFDEMFGQKQQEISSNKDSINGIFSGIKKSINDNILKNTYITYRVDKNGDILTYHDLARRNDSLVDAIVVLELKNQKQIKEIDIIGEKLTKYDILLSDHTELSYEYEYLKNINAFIKKHYDINVIEKGFKKNGKDFTRIILESSKIDSALLFYDKYKNRIYELEN